jgi:UDP-3-O-[3-hydroxymyristoyl] glucosamine N-acyltransferase
VSGKNYLIHENPSFAFQQVVELFLIDSYNQSGFTGIHETAIIHPTASLGAGVQIGPYVTIDQGAVIGEGTKILSHVSIGAGVRIGSHCILYSHAVIREKCILGHRVILQPGAIIGSCGFGFSTDAQGRHTKLEQLGIVEIEDDVEIGANTTIDRARFKKTLISQGTKVDNLVQVGHNVQLGPHNIIVSQTGISGSAKTGRNVVLGGQAGIVGHLHIAAGTLISARGGVSKTIDKPGKYAGTPVLPLAEHNRQQVHLRKIAEYVRRIEELEKKVSQLEVS